MYFKLKGNIDIYQIFDNENGGFDNKKFCKQIIDNDIKIEKYVTCAEIERNKEYYEKMHPTNILNEDYIKGNLSNEEIKNLFCKFSQPLNLNNCKLTIIDPYIFSKGTDSDLLTEILIENVKKKEIRFVTNQSKIDVSIKSNIETILCNNGFTINCDYRQDIHDRWWYSRCNGFTTGISFNGLNKKNSTIKRLEQDELNNIINDFGI